VNLSQNGHQKGRNGRRTARGEEAARPRGEALAAVQRDPGFTPVAVGALAQLAARRRGREGHGLGRQRHADAAEMSGVGATQPRWQHLEQRVQLALLEHLGLALPHLAGRLHPQYFLTGTGETQVNLSQNSPHT
jgi:hypothetical protein